LADLDDFEEIEAAKFDLEAEEEKEEVDSHTRRLNSTEREALEDGIIQTDKQLEKLMDEAESLGCEVPEDDKEYTEERDECKPILAEIADVKMKNLILEAVKELDDEIRSSEEERRKRSVETQNTLTLIDQQLALGAKRLSKGKNEVKLTRQRRESLEEKGRQQCLSLGKFDPNMSQKAMKKGHTIQSSLGGNIGLLVTSSSQIAHTYGQEGEYGCAATLCSGLRTNLGIGVGVTEGYYFNFKDVEGQSNVSIETVGWIFKCWVFKFSYGRVYKRDSNILIGRMIGVEVESNALPFLDATTFHCNTYMSEPCARKTVSKVTKEKYQKPCGLFKLWRCTRTRTKITYGFSYPCLE
jgi:hypothetical protein